MNDGSGRGAATPGLMEFPMTRSELELMGQGTQIRLQLDVATANEAVARLRATDRLSIGLKGNIRLQVQASN